jgi:hypothetical protein
MTNHEHDFNPQTQSDPVGCLGALVRLMWTAIGNVVLFACAISVAKGSAPVVADVIYFTVAVGLIAVRYIDITKFKGTTSRGMPATLAHWRRYAVLLAIISTVIWVLARVVFSHRWL